MKYAFVIDQRKCIGCHACTVACKAEHDVPIGVYRTWVKYVERGTFPDSRRYFLVNRCNHCDNAPCVTICPTKALYKREDGIVDFDAQRCIGCKSCMQACPYDALYIDPSTHTVAKCNYCAHRTEIGLEPACVVVCPERAIIAGDLHNSASEIARIVARQPVRVRKPEQGTGPNVYYLGADESTIHPEASVQELPHMSMWSTILRPADTHEEFDRATSLREFQPLHGHTSSEPTARTVYDTPKLSAPWGWKVFTYLGTKSLGAGAMIVAAIVLLLTAMSGPLEGSLRALFGIAAPVVGGAFIAATLILLVADLKRPDRALFLLTKANPTSWLVWGGYILAIFGLLEAAWFAAGVFDLPDLLRWLLVPTTLFGLAAAGYTAFLFGQAEGRDFWQSPLLLPILIAQALLAGASALSILSWLLPVSAIAGWLLTLVLLVSLAIHALLVLLEVLGRHPNSHSATAAHYMRAGELRDIFWGPFFAVGSLIPLLLLTIALLAPGAQSILTGFAAICALAGLFAYEYCFVKAGQIVPLS